MSNRKAHIITVTVMLENALWVGIFERHDAGHYAVARKIFGDEPTDPELYQFVSTHYQELRFTKPQDFQLIIKRKNFKRMQREVRKEMDKAKKSQRTLSHAQETLRLELEKNKKVAKQHSKAARDAHAERIFQLKQTKKKQKHRGH